MRRRVCNPFALGTLEVQDAATATNLLITLLSREIEVTSLGVAGVVGQRAVSNRHDIQGFTAAMREYQWCVFLLELL